MKCLNCGYPMKVDKIIRSGSYAQSKKVKYKCSAEDCTYTEVKRSQGEIKRERDLKINSPNEDEAFSN